MKCFACGAALPAHSRFCLECGTPVKILCPACDAAVQAEAGVCSGCGYTLSQGARVSSNRSVSAERRYITVMFCDLVDSTAFSVRLDPEDLGNLIRSYQDRVARIISQHNGFVARYVGDGVLVYFGWPTAHETDAERALRAALTLAAEVSATEVQGQFLQVRIGIATGLVMVGDRIVAGEAEQQTAIGEAPNRAARLQSLARPGGITIDAATRRHVGSLFDITALGARTLKGIPDPVEAFEVRAEHAGGLSRFEALHQAVTPLTGRKDELDILRSHWEEVKTSKSRTMLVSGEAGIGKSRLLLAFEDLLLPEQVVKVHYFCSPHHRDTPLYPVISQIERASNIVRDESDEAKLNNLTAYLSSNHASEQDVAQITDLVLPRSSPGLPTLNFSLRLRMQRIFAALVRTLEQIARVRPLLVVLEDLHWADATTRDFFDFTRNALCSHPVMLVATLRPDLKPPWIDEPGVSVLALGHLPRNDARALAGWVGGAGLQTPGLLDWIVDHSDGLPLFIEELTKGVVEGALGPTEQEQKLAVPTTLQASLMARIDRSPSARWVAQAGSVIGREFRYDLLARVACTSQKVLTEGLEQLVASGLLFRRGSSPNTSYFSFKHSLVQHAA
jgi:class 3 adenylate cyclase